MHVSEGVSPLVFLYSILHNIFLSRQALSHHHVFDDWGRPGSIIMGAVTIGTVKAPFNIISMVQNHSQHDLVFQGMLQCWGEVGGVDTGVVVYICPKLQQCVDQFIVALSKGHLQTVDGILVHHRPSLQQQAGALKIIVGHCEKEGRPALILIVAAHPRVQHEVWIITSFEQCLHTVGMPPSSCRMERTHPTFLHCLQFSRRDEVLQCPVKESSFSDTTEVQTLFEKWECKNVVT